MVHSGTELYIEVYGILLYPDENSKTVAHLHNNRVRLPPAWGWVVPGTPLFLGSRAELLKVMRCGSTHKRFTRNCPAKSCKPQWQSLIDESNTISQPRSTHKITISKVTERTGKIRPTWRSRSCLLLDVPQSLVVFLLLDVLSGLVG